MWLTLTALLAVYVYGSHISDILTITHEGISLYARVHEYYTEVISGFFQPMLFQHAIRGAGFAFPVFYPPFSYYVATLLRVVTDDLILSVNLALFLSGLLSAITCYFCAYDLSRRPSIAFAAAAIYSTALYHIIDVYVRGALAECYAFVWFPVAIQGGFRVLSGRRGGWRLAVGLAGCLLSHSVLTMYFIPICALMFVPGILVSRRWRAVLPLVAYGVLALGIAGFYVVPQQVYLPDVWASDAEYMWARPRSVLLHHLTFNQLFFAKQDWWFGNSYEHYEDQFCFRMGLGHLLALGTALAAVVRWRAMRRASSRAHAGVILGAIASWVVLVAFMLNPALFITWMPEKLAYIQFGWRLLAILAVVAAVLFAMGARALAWRGPAAAITVACALAGLVLLADVPSFAFYRRIKTDLINEGFQPWFLEENGLVGFTELAEYLPRTYPVKQEHKPFLTHPVVTNGSLLEWTRKSPANYVLRGTGEQNARAVLPLISYPFWKATVNGEETPTTSTQGFIALNLPRGEFSIELQRGYTRPFYAGWAVSAVSIVLTIGAAWLERRRRSRGGYRRGAPAP